MGYTRGAPSHSELAVGTPRGKELRNIKVILQYKGTNYAGFQKQPDESTIQGVLEKTLAQVLQEDITLVGAGRTDAGVHARGQVANFLTLSDIDCGRLRWSVNSLLPRDIVIKEAVEVSEGFHARRDAAFREYRYLILNRDYPSPFWNDFSYFYSQPLDVEAMRKGAGALVGVHDFSSFCVGQSKPENCMREVQTISVGREGDFIHFDITANAFLHNMVRVMVGTLVQVGTGELPPAKVQKILEAEDRTQAGPTAPAHGLFLIRVNY